MSFGGRFFFYKIIWCTRRELREGLFKKLPQDVGWEKEGHDSIRAHVHQISMCTRYAPLFLIMSHAYRYIRLVAVVDCLISSSRRRHISFLSRSLSLYQQPTPVYNIQHIVKSISVTSAFSLSVSITIIDLTISDNGFCKRYYLYSITNFETYTKHVNRNYIID
jgi:hypothetical protein